MAAEDEGMGDSKSIADTRLVASLSRLAAGDRLAREEILEICNDRLRILTSRLLDGFGKVRRWDSTDDVAQNAALRLYRALAEIAPPTPRALTGLMITQIRRELIDLARRHAGPLGYAANHDTNAERTTDGGSCLIVEGAVDAGADEPGTAEHWERFHGAVAELPVELREVFEMAWYLGLDQQVAASVIGCSVKTVGRRWQKAVSLVRARLGDA